MDQHLHRVGRFSEGLHRDTDEPLRTGRFSDGLAQDAEPRHGCFSDGMVAAAAPRARRHGRYSDGQHGLIHLGLPEPAVGLAPASA